MAAEEELVRLVVRLVGESTSFSKSLKDAGLEVKNLEKQVTTADAQIRSDQKVTAAAIQASQSQAVQAMMKAGATAQETAKFFGVSMKEIQSAVKGTTAEVVAGTAAQVAGLQKVQIQSAKTSAAYAAMLAKAKAAAVVTGGGGAPPWGPPSWGAGGGGPPKGPSMSAMLGGTYKNVQADPSGQFAAAISQSVSAMQSMRIYGERNLGLINRMASGWGSVNKFLQEHISLLKIITFGVYAAALRIILKITAALYNWNPIIIQFRRELEKSVEVQKMLLEGQARLVQRQGELAEGLQFTEFIKNLEDRRKEAKRQYELAAEEVVVRQKELDKLTGEAVFAPRNKVVRGPGWVSFFADQVDAMGGIILQGFAKIGALGHQVEIEQERANLTAAKETAALRLKTATDLTHQIELQTDAMIQKIRSAVKEGVSPIQRLKAGYKEIQLMQEAAKLRGEPFPEEVRLALLKKLGEAYDDAIEKRNELLRPQAAVQIGSLEGAQRAFDLSKQWQLGRGRTILSGWEKGGIPSEGIGSSVGGALAGGFPGVPSAPMTPRQKREAARAQEREERKRLMAERQAEQGERIVIAGTGFRPDAEAIAKRQEEARLNRESHRRQVEHWKSLQTPEEKERRRKAIMGGGAPMTPPLGVPPGGPSAREQQVQSEIDAMRKRLPERLRKKDEEHAKFQFFREKRAAERGGSVKLRKQFEKDVQTEMGMFGIWGSRERFEQHQTKVKGESGTSKPVNKSSPDELLKNINKSLEKIEEHTRKSSEQPPVEVIEGNL